MNILVLFIDVTECVQTHETTRVRSIDPIDRGAIYYVWQDYSAYKVGSR